MSDLSDKSYDAPGGDIYRQKKAGAYHAET